MDEIKKLFRKIPKKDRLLIEDILQKLLKKQLKGLKIQKLKGYKYIFRIRAGDYRIFYYHKDNEIILKTIKQRNESTYRDF